MIRKPMTQTKILKKHIPKNMNTRPENAYERPKKKMKISKIKKKKKPWRVLTSYINREFQIKNINNIALPM